ncbi:MAG TPA: ATP-binding protein [Acidovorax sp.]|nr:ATP-binding protein [Acidovorax sp.]
MRQAPGLRAGVNLANFGPTEIEIVNNLATIWYIAEARIHNVGQTVAFPYVFLKPCDGFKEKFNLMSDVLCLFHPYPAIDSRVPEAIEKLLEKYPQRIDRLCIVLVTNAESTVLDRPRQADSDPRSVVPFKYRELRGGVAGKERLMIERFELKLFSKDLFAMSSALKSEQFFYGRTSEIQRLFGHYQSNENSTVFGLRRIGKTSVLWAVVRHLKTMGVAVALIDGNDARYHRATWNKALYRVKEAVFKVNGLKGGHVEAHYTEADATTCFGEDLRIGKNKTGKPVLIIFDEIQNLCFDVSTSDAWRSGNESIPFWQAIRSVYQQNQNLFSFILGGTNAHIIEAPHSGSGADNPLFGYIAPHYLGFFTWQEVKGMVEHIGAYMGVTFDESIFHYLSDDFGGHPFLIRQACSKLWDLQATPNLPRRVHTSKTYYQSNKDKLFEHTRNYIAMILEVLTERYQREFEMLRLLAAGDQERFRIYAESSPRDVMHLLGYGLIEKPGDNYTFRISAVEAAVKRNARDLVCPDVVEERWALLSRERNQFEYRFRDYIRSALKVAFGKEKAKEEIIAVMHKASQADAARGLEYDQIFSKEIYFLNLKDVTLKHWDRFKFLFNEDKQRFINAMDFGNKYRADAHAKTLTAEQFRAAMPQLVWLATCFESNS